MLHLFMDTVHVNKDAWVWLKRRALGKGERDRGRGEGREWSNFGRVTSIRRKTSLDEEN